EEVARHDLDSRQVLPHIGIPDLRTEPFELGERFGLRRIGHPVNRLNSLAIGATQVLDEVDHLLLGGGRKVPLDVDTAERLTEAFARADEHDAAFPAIALLGLA